MPDAVTPLDKILHQQWQAAGCPIPARCSDAVFLRRAYLTVTGRIPTSAEARDFLADKSDSKRSQLIDKLLASPEYADLLAMRFADMLRIKSEFPINLWPNAVQAWHRQIRTELLEDRSYRDMAYDMLTASGSNFRIPHANFFRASANRSPAGLADITAQTFMGLRLENHPIAIRNGLEPFFSQIRYKSTYEWKEEIVYNNYTPTQITAQTPDGKTFTINSPAEDPRQIFAKWLLADSNPWFARAAVNRIWHWVFGSGISGECDDLPLSAATSPLESFLITQFRDSGYSIRTLLRLILNSQAFHASAMNTSSDALKAFAAFPIRRLDAEVLIDALAAVTNGYDSYMSVIPEPFTFLPNGTKAININDGSISSSTLDAFGRPSRDSGRVSERKNTPSENQMLYLMNSGTLYRRLNGVHRKLFASKKLNFNQRVREIYLHILSRYPTPAEIEKIKRYQQTFPKKETWKVWPDLAWMLVNSTEFSYMH